ncbi:hypothetical protein K435DRAFT_664735 [Dendrothele bispora CBS 962.96]|uniref:DUF6533 domain-containing protein n=1 Tax=Dendrothele bispora (strain CBS 962.96) TaxID=1314807 RepID=A0A4V4HFU2_DENBC|nr:hypothetical protein K435DRAFT_664735 [Dendrothele bispora CBS 962.96]
MLYDYFLTIDREIELIWFSDWNLVKVLYLIQRYLPFVDFLCHLDLEFLKVLQVVHRCFFLKFIRFGGIAILSIRTWAIWKNYRLVNFAIPVYFMGAWIACTVFSFIYTNSIGFIYAPFPGLTGCWAVSGDNYLLLGSWFMFFTFESGRHFFSGLSSEEK